MKRDLGKEGRGETEAEGKEDEGDEEEEEEEEETLSGRCVSALRPCDQSVNTEL